MTDPYVDDSLPGYDEWKTRSPDDEDPQPETCQDCGGSGMIEVNDNEYVDCQGCDGTGER